MWKNILVGVDNSLHSLWATDLSVTLARASEGSVTGCHVYAVKLHDDRFKAMEYTLPKKYLKDAELERQRDVHGLLIGKGMQVISDSYMDVVEKKCSDAGIRFRGVSLEGKNYKRLIEEATGGEATGGEASGGEGAGGGYDLVVLGSLGVGATETSKLGSVALRTARRLDKDLLIVKNETQPRPGDKVVVCMDGSPYSYAGLDIALELAKAYDLKVHIAAVYDPYFHTVIFNSISKVLSEEGSKIFRFKEQEELHDGIIDDGLAKIYGSHLKVAAELASKGGITPETHLLSGKAPDALAEFVAKESPWLVIAGRVGSHAEDCSDIGAVTERLLFDSESNLLLTSRMVEPPPQTVLTETMKWTEDAEKFMGRAPAFVRKMAAGVIEKHASEKGHSVVTCAVIKDALSKLMPAHLKKLKKSMKE